MTSFIAASVYHRLILPWHGRVLSSGIQETVSHCDAFLIHFVRVAAQLSRSVIW